MSTKTILSLALLTATASLTACDQTEIEDGTRPARGVAAGKADGAGSCEDACGGQALDGACYCDDSCSEYGDCCEDYEPVCMPPEAAPGDGCDLLDGCDAGQYCEWSGEGQSGTCVEASELVHDARLALAGQFHDLAIPTDGPATVQRRLSVFDGGVATGSSNYVVELDLGADRVAHVRFDLAANHVETWRVVPEDIRTTAPWGNNEFIVPGTVSMAMDSSATLDDIHAMIVGPVLDELSMSNIDKTSDDSQWLFYLQTPGFAELEAISKLEGEPTVNEAWPNRINFLQPAGGSGVEVIAEF